MKLKLNPTQQIIVILELFALGAIIKNYANPQVYMHLAATVGFGIALFFLFKFISKQNKNIWNTLISCLIIFLVLHYGISLESVVPSLLVTSITIFSKFFLTYKGSPIFNPVVLGLFVLAILSKFIPILNSNFASWWGAAYKFNEIPVTLFIIAIWIIFWFKNWRKWAIPFSYLLSFLVLAIIFYKGPEGFSTMEMIKGIFIDSTIYFFAFIMLSEPRTSPILKSQQIIYGLIAGIFYTISLVLGYQLAGLLAILVPNLYFFITKWLMMRKMNNQNA